MPVKVDSSRQAHAADLQGADGYRSFVGRQVDDVAYYGIGKIYQAGFLHAQVNVLQLPEGGDFEALRCQPSTNFDRSTKLDLTTEPPLLGRCCYRLPFFPSEVLSCIV